MEENKRPEKKFVAGAISATIWQNIVQKDGKESSYRTISIVRNYKDRDGNWKQTSSLRVTDIPKAVLVLNKAYEYINLKDFSDYKNSDYKNDEDIEVEGIKEEDVA